MIKRYNEFLENVDNKFDTRIISAFPGCGKTTFFNKMKEKYNDDVCIDSDSSKFSWVVEDGEKKRNPDFPSNYIEHIKENMGKYKYIFVSTHENVRDALIDNNLPFYIVYPNISMKEEYLKRYRNRGNDDNFIKLLEDNWETWINNIINFDNKLCTKLELSFDKPYLSDVLEKIDND